MEIREALAAAEKQLAGRYGQGPEARLLLAKTLGVSPSYLLAHGEEPLAAATLTNYSSFLQRAAQGEPIPYILGTAPFFDLNIRVSPAVLIPRPETEQLVELVVKWVRQRGLLSPSLVDVGTGSGCIAIALARQLPQAAITAVDISPVALTLAQENAQTNRVNEQIQFHLGHLLSPINSSSHLIVANLPYIRDDEWTRLDDGVKSYEPALALRGGVDGLMLIEELLAQAQTKLASGGAIFLEIGWQQGAAATQLAQRYFPAASVQCQPDYAGQDRFVIIQT